MFGFFYFVYPRIDTVGNQKHNQWNYSICDTIMIPFTSCTYLANAVETLYLFVYVYS